MRTINRLTAPLECDVLAIENDSLIVEDIKTGERIALKLDPILKSVFCINLDPNAPRNYAESWDFHRGGKDRVRIVPFVSTHHKGEPFNKQPYNDYEVIDLFAHNQIQKFMEKGGLIKCPGTFTSSF